MEIQGRRVVVPACVWQRHNAPARVQRQPLCKDEKVHSHDGLLAVRQLSRNSWLLATGAVSGPIVKGSKALFVSFWFQASPSVKHKHAGPEFAACLQRTFTRESVSRSQL